MDTLPIISLKQLKDLSSPSGNEEHKRLYETCLEHGFFYLKDHGISPEDDAFVVNLGDMLQLWTNGLFVSTPHEVMHKLEQSRISIPFFVYPNVNAVFQPIGSDETINPTEVMLNNFNAIWVEKTGGGRAKELK